MVEKSKTNKKTMSQADRGFLAAVAFAVGIAFEINPFNTSYPLVLTFYIIGAVILVIGYFIAYKNNDPIFWSRTAVTMSLPLLAFGSRIAHSDPITSWLLIILAVIMIVLGFCLYLKDKVGSRNKEQK